MVVAVARVPAKAAARVTAKVAADLMGKEHRWPLTLVAAAVTVAVAAAVAVATEMVVLSDAASPSEVGEEIGLAMQSTHRRSTDGWSLWRAPARTGS